MLQCSGPAPLIVSCLGAYSDLSFRVTTVPVFFIAFVSILVPMALLGYDGWIFRKMFRMRENKYIETPQLKIKYVKH